MCALMQLCWIASSNRTSAHACLCRARERDSRRVDEGRDRERRHRDREAAEAPVAGNSGGGDKQHSSRDKDREGRDR